MYLLGDFFWTSVTMSTSFNSYFYESIARTFWAMYCTSLLYTYTIISVNETYARVVECKIKKEEKMGSSIKRCVRVNIIRHVHTKLWL